MIFRRVFARCRCALLAAWTVSAIYTAIPAQEAGLTDRQVEQALRAAILGDAEAIRDVAEERRAQEQAAATARFVPTPISSAIATLAASVDRPLPHVREQRRAISGYRRSQVTRNLEELLRREEPRQRYLEARWDRRYETLRRGFNGIVNPLSGLLQGQFFPLLALPFEAADYLFVGRLYPTPEQRKELYLARAAAAASPGDSASESARSLLEKVDARRTRLASLQARENARKAAGRGSDWAAVFWYEREQALQGWSSIERSRHREALRRFAVNRSRRVESGIVNPAGDQFRSPEEFGAYRDLLRHFVLRNYEAESLPPFRETAVAFQGSHPTSQALPAVLAAEAAHLQGAGNQALAAVYLRQLSGDSLARGGWSGRAGDILSRPRFEPEEGLREARSAINSRWWAYILQAGDPRVLDRHLTAEESRLRRAIWVQRARGLFLTDSLARFLFLPFAGPFPEPELPDAAASVDPGWLASPEGEDWARRLATAYRREGRYTDAFRLYESLGDERRARRMAHRAARQLERRGDGAGSAIEAVHSFERLVTAWPDFRHHERAVRKLQEARREADTILVIGRAELEAWPELAAEDALGLSAALLDGDRETGEIGRGGVSLLRYGAYSYEDLRTGRTIELPLDGEQMERLLVLLEPRRRTQSVREELRRPTPRKRIPIALEAGFLPGFDVGPSLVPLDPRPEERRLYE